MKFSYKISSELNIIILFCRGSITRREFLDGIQKVYRDGRYKRGMLRIIDLYFAEDHFRLDDMHAILQEIETMKANGVELDRAVLLSQSTGVHLLMRSMKMMPVVAESKFNACYSLDDAITFLKLSDREGIKKFYEESKSFEL